MKAGVSEDVIVFDPFSVATHYEWVYEKIEESSSEKYREEYRRVQNEADGYDYEGSLSIELSMDFMERKTQWVKASICLWKTLTTPQKTKLLGVVEAECI